MLFGSSGAGSRLPRKSSCFLQIPYPNVPIANWVPVILEHQGFLGIVFLITRGPDVYRGSLEFDVVLDKYAVVEDGHVSWLQDFSIFGKARSMEDDVVRLPLTRPTARIHEWDVLFVDAPPLTIRISSSLVGVEDLDLVLSLKEDATVAASLSFPLDLRGSPPLHVELTVAESTLGLNVASTPHDGEGSADDTPLRLAAVPVPPLGEVFAIEEHDCIIGRGSPYTRVYDRRYWVPHLSEFRIPLRLLPPCGNLEQQHQCATEN